MKRRIKKQEGELLDDDHILKVMAHLEGGGTKKEAYEILNIKANPTRLARIIEEYEERQQLNQKLRKANRGKPASDIEINQIIQASLDGETLTSLADDLYRPIDFIKRVIDGVGIPQKLPGNWYDRRYKTSIPDQCISDSFSLYEIVWSNHYNGLAIVLEPGEATTHIYVIEKVEEEPSFSINGKVYTGYGGRHAWQRNEELGSLKHLEKYGVNLYKTYEPYFPNWLGKRRSSAV